MMRNLKGGLTTLLNFLNKILDKTEMGIYNIPVTIEVEV